MSLIYLRISEDIDVISVFSNHNKYFCERYELPSYAKADIMANKIIIREGGLNWGGVNLGDKAGVQFYPKRRLSCFTYS